jgi:hypothetical protein
MLISITMFLISGIAAISSDLIYILFVVFAFSMASFFRLFTYSFGKIPIVMSDKTWERYRNKYSREELEERYKEMSIKRASFYFVAAIISFAIWLPWEIIQSICNA